MSVALLAFLGVKNRPSDIGQQPDNADADSRSDIDNSPVPVPAVYRTREIWTVRQAIRTPALWLLSLAAVGECASSAAALAHAVPHLRDLGHSAPEVGAAMALFSICAIVGKLSIGLLGDRMEPRNAWSACVVMMGLAIWVATRAESAGAMFLFTGMLGLGSGGALTCWHATVTNYFGPASFAAVLGAQLPLSNVVSAAAPFLVGLMYDTQHSYTLAFYGVAAFAVVAGLALLLAAPPKLSASRTDAYAG
jgi:MFS family permease